jgi:hypothetical protein
MAQDQSRTGTKGLEGERNVQNHTTTSHCKPNSNNASATATQKNKPRLGGWGGGGRSRATKLEGARIMSQFYQKMIFHVKRLSRDIACCNDMTVHFLRDVRIKCQRTQNFVLKYVESNRKSIQSPRKYPEAQNSVPTCVKLHWKRIQKPNGMTPTICDASTKLHLSTTKPDGMIFSEQNIVVSPT